MVGAAGRSSCVILSCVCGACKASLLRKAYTSTSFLELLTSVSGRIVHGVGARRQRQCFVQNELGQGI